MWLKEYYEVLGAATKKAQAYTDQEVSKVRTKFAVVASYADLPNPGRTDTIYLVPKAGFVSVYDQYIYENNQYTDIGDTELDLDSYATDLELSQGLATKVDKVEGYGLSKNDFTDEKDTKLAGIETGAQVNVTPDAALDETSTNAIQNKAVTEKFKEVEAEILNEDFVAEGNPIAIETGSIGTAKSTELTMSPIQDLHGYDKPWVGGSGKNKLPNNVLATETINQVTFTVNNDGTVSLSGTASDIATITGTFSLKSGSYIFTSGVTETYLTYDSFLQIGNTTIARGDNNNAPGNAFTLSEDSTVSFKIRVRSGVNSSGVIFKPMIRLSSESSATFESYSNVCPISGRTQAEIVGCGGNIIDNNLESGSSNQVTYTVNADKSITVNGTASNTSGYMLFTNVSTKFNLIPGATYYIGHNIPNSDVEIQVYVDSTFYDNTTGAKKKITIPSTATTNTYARLRVGSGKAINNLKIYPMIALHDYTEWEAPKQKTSVTIPFGSTIYGGTLDVETGLLTIEWVGATIDGDAVSTINGSSGADSLGGKRIDTNISGAYYAGSASSDVAKILSDKLEAVSSSNIYSGNPQPNTVSVSGANVVVLRYDGANTKEDAQAKLNANPVQVCYKLATPTTTTLTAAQINLIKGLNNISTDADSIKMTYTINDFVTKTEMNTALESKANVIDLNGKADLTSFGPLEEGTTASTNYAEGDYMIFEGKFCKASTAITAGDTLEIGTNLTETTIAAELLSIISQLPTT